jgi:hypothetical protein
MRHVLSAAALLLAATVTGHGAIYYSGIRNIGIPSNDIGVAIRLSDELVTQSLVVDLDSGPWINFFFSGHGIASSTYLRPAITTPPSGNGDGLVVKKVSMQDIGAADHFASGSNGSENHIGAGTSQFQEGSPGYIGFAMRSTLSSTPRYGWMRVTINGTNPGVIHDWAYENTPGMSILAGSVPEPSSSLLLVSTALVCCFLRRRVSNQPMAE